MKAAQIKEYGDSTKIEVTEVDKPIAGEGQVVVEVHASSLNPIDSVLRSGAYHTMMPLTFPATLGGDIAGIVTEVAEGVTNVAVGDKVYGQANAAFGNSGAFAEYAATASGMVAKAPENIDFAQAASLPLAGASAVQALIDTIKLAAGQKILITGGAGGIGSIAIQIAKSIGASTTVTATGKGIELAKALGADEVIDYAVQELDILAKEFDAVFDTVGSEFDSTLALLKPGGTAISMAAQVNEDLAKELEVAAISQMTSVNTESLGKLRELVESGAVKPQVGQVFTLDDISAAFEAKENGQVVGKVAIQIR